MSSLLSIYSHAPMHQYSIENVFLERANETRQEEKDAKLFMEESKERLSNCDSWIDAGTAPKA
jgi:hypothetical protein